MTVKGQALADFLGAHPVPETSKLHTDISDEVIKANMTSEDNVWQMFFDGTLRTSPTTRTLLEWGCYLSLLRIIFFLVHSH